MQTDDVRRERQSVGFSWQAGKHGASAVIQSSSEPKFALEKCLAKDAEALGGVKLRHPLVDNCLSDINSRDGHIRIESGCSGMLSLAVTRPMMMHTSPST